MLARGPGHVCNASRDLSPSTRRISAVAPGGGQAIFLVLTHHGSCYVGSLVSVFPAVGHGRFPVALFPIQLGDRV